MNYVIVTAVQNEEDYIELTIKSVIEQTILPKKWVIVNDGSTDKTESIVEAYMKDREWIEMLKIGKRKDRNFSGKALAFNAGCDRLKGLKYDIIGNVDGDISFEKDFFQYLIRKFEQNPELGVAGTHYIEGDLHSFRDSYINVHHVNGQCQLFRRKCFEDIGGYVPVKEGGIDWIAVTTARMKGWETYSFDERTFIHHRAMGTAGSDIYRSRFNYGKKDYFLGGHPLWQVCRGVFQMAKKPYIVGGLLLIFGYVWAWATGMERPVSKELMEFHRGEQIDRLKNMMLRRVSMSR